MGSTVGTLKLGFQLQEEEGVVAEVTGLVAVTANFC